jgi:hypothetical protein
MPKSGCRCILKAPLCILQNTPSYLPISVLFLGGGGGVKRKKRGRSDTKRKKKKNGKCNSRIYTKEIKKRQEIGRFVSCKYHYIGEGEIIF